MQTAQPNMSSSNILLVSMFVLLISAATYYMLYTWIHVPWGLPAFFFIWTPSCHGCTFARFKKSSGKQMLPLAQGVKNEKIAKARGLWKIRENRVNERILGELCLTCKRCRGAYCLFWKTSFLVGWKKVLLKRDAKNARYFNCKNFIDYKTSLCQLSKFILQI